MVFCRKTSGACLRLAPTYVGITGEGEDVSFTHRLGSHLGRHFRLPGHNAHRDLVMLPIEVISAKDVFLLRARETFNISKFRAEKDCRSVILNMV